MSHKGGYVGKSGEKRKRSKTFKAALGRVLDGVNRLCASYYEMGFRAGKDETTTGSGPAVSPGKNIGHGAGRGAKKPNGRK